jgi:hypothetical protein
MEKFIGIITECATEDYLTTLLWCLLLLISALMICAGIQFLRR